MNMNKILVASCFYELPIKIEQHLKKMGLSAELTVAQSADEVLHALSEVHYDGLFSEYAINDIDIWKLSALVQSSRFNDYAVPLYLVQESFETEIPLILSNEYQFNVIALEQLPEVLKKPSIPDDFKPTLLVIEDEPDAANIAFHALEGSYIIDIVRDGQAGYQKWLEQRHDLILLDLMLPGLSGDQVLAKILAVDSDQSVIVVTAFSDIENHKKLMINGANEFLAKPYTLLDLRRLCQFVCSRAKLVSEIHYREDKLKQLSHQFWLWDQCVSKQDSVSSERVRQRIQSIIPVIPPGDDEQLELLQSVALR